MKKKKLKILFCYSDMPIEWNCSEWRCAIPHSAINTLEDYEARMCNLSNFALMDKVGMGMAAWADVIVIQRNFAGHVFLANEYWKSMGKIMVLDIDDDYLNMPSDIRSYEYWINGIVRDAEHQSHAMPYKPVEQLKWAMKLVHAVTTPSEVIAADWRYITPYTTLLPNYLDFKRYDGLARNIDQPIFVGWGGSLTHYNSFKASGLFHAIRRIIEKYPNVIFVAMGDPAIYHTLKVSPRRKILIPWMLTSEWPKALAESIDIGLAPLAGQYDLRRSWIKPLEYMALGIPCIATDSYAYKVFEDNITLTTNTMGAWEYSIAYMIDNFTKEKQKAMQNIEVAKSLDATTNASRIASVFQEIYDSHLV